MQFVKQFQRELINVYIKRALKKLKCQDEFQIPQENEKGFLSFRRKMNLISKKKIGKKLLQILFHPTYSRKEKCLLRKKILEKQITLVV